MTIPGRLTVGADGKVTGPATISYNAPFPTANGTPGGGAPSMMGVIMHTEVGFEAGTIETFNNPASEASAFFAIGQNGAIWQFGPVGANWMAWAQAAGNPMWYSVEDADRTHPSIPLTDAQVRSFAQLLECLSTFAGFPLQVSDSVDTQGLGWHGMGGVPWGDHPDCPGGIRKGQRPAIVALAREIRAGGPPEPAEVRCPAGSWTKVGGVEVRPADHDVVLLVRSA
jgi:N-acetylmuramoyl-L-alanine amidase